MLKYDKVYFLHIPKTGGRFFVEYILKPIEKTLKENNIEIIKLNDGVNKHGGWHKDIDDKTYVISVMRDPVEFFVSLVAHMAADQNGLIDDEKDFIIKEKSKSLNIEKDFLFNQLKELKYLKNFQSQNFILSPETKSIVVDSRKAYNTNKEFDDKLAYERIKRVNLMIRHKDLTLMDYNILINKISNDLEIDIDIDLSSASRDHYKNNSSEILLNKLNEEDKKIIYSNFLFDKEIYQNDSLFWKEK
jgi:hypothetical protein